MSDLSTNKELLTLLVSQTKDLNVKVDKLAKDHFTMSLKFSDYINSQDKENIYFKNILEGNKNTNTKGVAEQVHNNSQDINLLKIDKKVTAGKIGVAGLIFTVIGGILLKVLGVIKFLI